MPPTLETVEADAMQLSREERALLAERLRASVDADADADPDVEAAWAAEIARRNRAIDDGTATILDGPTALAELEREFA